MTLQASRYRYPSIFFLTWRMFSCLRCCPRPKLRMTMDSTIPSLQRSSVPSNIRKKISLSFKFLFKYCFLLKFKTFWSNLCWDASSYSPTAPKLLISWRSCLWPGQHLTQCPSRTYHDKGISDTSHLFILLTVSSRSQSICFKARQLLLSNLVLTLENREMHHCVAWQRWLLTRLCMLQYRYVLRYYFFFFPDIWHMILTRHALLWVRQVHGQILMGCSGILTSTGK